MRHLLRSTRFLFLALALACGGESDDDDDDDDGADVSTEEGFVKAYADATCVMNEACFPAYFQAEYRDMDDCVGDIEGVTDEAVDFFDDQGCTYEPEVAARCIDALSAYADTCDEREENDVADDCGDVWDCTNAYQ